MTETNLDCTLRTRRSIEPRDPQQGRHEAASKGPFRVCFLGGARYTRPLESTSAKKFRLLRSLGAIFVVGFSCDARPRVFTQEARFYLLPALPSPVIRYVSMFTVGSLLALWCILRHRARIVVAQSPYEAIAGVCARAVARLFGRRVSLIVESHGDFEGAVFLYRSIRAAGLYRAVMRRTAACTVPRADGLRAISGVTREQLARLAPGKDIAQFTAWTDLEAFAVPEGDARTEAGRRMVLFAGSLVRIKGIHHLVDAFAALHREFPDVDLVLAGDHGDRSYVDFLERQIDARGIRERVRMVGSVDQVELGRLMRGAEVVVLPSLSEGLGRVLLEAMYCGTAVVGTRVGGIPELIHDGLNGFLVTPGSASELAERLAELLRDSARAREMGRSGRGLAESMASPTAYREGYAALFAAFDPLPDIAEGRQ